MCRNACLPPESKPSRCTASAGRPLLTRITFSACRAHYPGGSVRCSRLILTRSRAGLFPNRTGLPVHNGRSASTVFVSRPARASLVLRPADLLTHLSWAWLRGFDGIRYQVPSLVSYPGIPRTPGVGLSPTGDSRRKGARSVATPGVLVRTGWTAEFG